MWERKLALEETKKSSLREEGFGRRISIRLSMDAVAVGYRITSVRLGSWMRLINASA